MGLILNSRFRLALVLFLIVPALLYFLTLNLKSEDNVVLKNSTWWEVQSIDTVKYSRDLAREKINDASFVEVVNNQVKSIADVGATYISLGTPYDEEFIPFLTLWIEAARENGLNVWFRGNFSGWEGWFGYERISAGEHIKKTREFIHSNKSLFEDGDIFTSCTECENGQLGDPRYEIDVGEYRNFIIEEYYATRASFNEIGKDVAANYYPMNGDVARLVMDKKTTKSLGGVVVVDHYVKDPKQLAQDLTEITESSGGSVVLGEFGAPIPDIHGYMNENRQADWVNEVLGELSKVKDLIGVNYWTNSGGSTQLWTNDEPRKAVSIVKSYFSPEYLRLVVVNEIGKPVKNAVIIAGIKTAKTDRNGGYMLAVIPSVRSIKVGAGDYMERQFNIEELNDMPEIILVKEDEGVIFKFLKLFSK